MHYGVGVCLFASLCPSAVCSRALLQHGLGVAVWNTYAISVASQLTEITVGVNKLSYATVHARA